MRNSSSDLAEDFFSKTRERGIGFEITLAALLATLVLTYPIPSNILLSQFAAFLLLLITLIRRVAQASPFAPEEEIMDATTPFLVNSTALCLISLLSFVTFQASISGISKLWIFSLITVATLGLLLGFQEVILRDYLIWWYAKFKEKSERGDFPEGLWEDISHISYQFSRARQNHESHLRLREVRQRSNIEFPDPSELLFEDDRDLAKTLLASLLFIFLLYLIPLGAGFGLLGIEVILVLPAVVFAYDHSGFWYIAYGNVTYEDLRAHLLWIIPRTLLYLIIVAVIYKPDQIFLVF